jgi:DNA repair protein RadA/Sms
LSGELRSVSQIERRLTEAGRMGFQRAFIAGRTPPRGDFNGLVAVPTPDLRALISHIDA